jgi:hypothetical protein
MGTLDEQIRRASLSFKNRLEPTELADMQCQSLEELEREIDRIQRQQKDRKQMMNFNRIKGFLEAMSQFESTIKVFTNSFDMVAYIWGPIKLLLSVKPAYPSWSNLGLTNNRLPIPGQRRLMSSWMHTKRLENICHL